MAEFVTEQDQRWETAQLSGLTVQECRLWQQPNLYTGLFRLPTGFRFPHHAHENRVQLYVLSGSIRVDLDGQEPRTVAAGESYFVEPGDPHVETVEEDLTVLVVTAENRESLYDAFV